MDIKQKTSHIFTLSSYSTDILGVSNSQFFHIYYPIVNNINLNTCLKESVTLQFWKCEQGLRIEALVSILANTERQL